MFQRPGIALCCMCAALLSFLAMTRVGSADVVISSAATANMDCSAGFCEPTAPNAVLNATDLENLLAQDGNVRVMTAGQGVEAKHIVVKVALATPDSTSLGLDALDAITVDAPVSIGNNFAELELQSGTAGTLGDVSFGPDGNVTFGSTSDLFDINGAVFQLVATLPDLATEANSAPSGFYALTGGYDAKQDGSYRTSPIHTRFTGYFEALGNTISNLKIKVSSGGDAGLFADIAGDQGFGVVRNLRLVNATVEGNPADEVGGVAGYLEHGATILQSSIEGEVKGGDDSLTGGIVAELGGSIVSSWSSANVIAGDGSDVGGLAGAGGGTVSNSYATGRVSSGIQSLAGGLIAVSGSTLVDSFATGMVRNGGGGSYAGGLVGLNLGSIENSYAEGGVSESIGGGTSYLGGLIGGDESGVSDSYSTGAVTGSGSDVIGGMVGFDDSAGAFSHTYWDTKTSGLSQGSGNITDDTGMTGVTSARLRSGLPRGFSRNIWKQKGKTNHGYPYLTGNPPPK